MKKITALIIAVIMVFALCACRENAGINQAASTEPLTKEDVIEVTIISHPSWPYQEKWKVWEYIEEGVGATLDINAVPSSDYSTKYPLMFAAADTLPDVAAFDNKPSSDRYALQGALVAFDDMEEYMPNYRSFVSSMTEDELQSIVNTRKASDGKIYYTPVSGRERSQNVRAWLYRKDIFEKHNLSVPTTFDELYEVCKQLKVIYPESYPYCLRQKFTNLDVSGPSWEPYWNIGMYYDYTVGEWKFGAMTDTMKDVLEFYRKMMEEELMPSNFYSINAQSWQELITTDRGFIMPEYQTRIDFFNGLAKENNPGFELAAMVPPVANPEKGSAMVNKYNVDPYGFVICNTRDEKRIVNAAKYTDWFYSDEAAQLVGWGKEGETYNVIDGKKVFITDENGAQPNTLYGFSTPGSFARIDSTAIEAMETENIAKTREIVLGYTVPYANPTTFLAFTEEEQKTRDELYTQIYAYMEETVMKFLLGQKPISEFDGFREDLRSMGINELLDVYNTAYNRVK